MISSGNFARDGVQIIAPVSLAQLTQFFLWAPSEPKGVEKLSTPVITSH